MERHCEEQEDLTDKVEKQAVSEMEPEPLIELREEIEYRRDNVVNLVHMLWCMLVSNIGNLILPPLCVCTGFDHNINGCLFSAG